MQHRAPLEDFPEDKFEQIMATNVTSVFLVGQAVARRMIPRGAGKIINICSLMSTVARPSIAPYAASKAAVANLTRGMATEWARHGLNVNGIAPGYFKTELNAALVADPDFNAWITKRTPMGRWGEVEELGGAAIFLAPTPPVRQRPHPLCRRRLHGDGVSLPPRDRCAMKSTFMIWPNVPDIAWAGRSSHVCPVSLPSQTLSLVPARIIIVMGVSSSGKTVVGQAIARRLHAPFLDGDDYHPPANKEKMRAGIPLTDEDRWPWLATLATGAARSRRTARASRWAPARR